jgi:sulfatase maturation enzyme AslB (radical SAM superfamily)
MINQTGCFLPLGALAVHPHGERKFCLTFNLPPGTEEKDFELQRIETHKALLAGEWPAGCRFCKNSEAKGIQSRRTRTWERKSARYGNKESFQMLKEQQVPYIRHLEITFSNLCNLSCAMCTSEFSSSWVKLDKEALRQGFSFREFTRPFHKVNRISESVMDEVLEHVYEYDLIIIKGGEPTIEPLCLEFLKRVGSLRPKDGPYVFIQTNGTRNPAEWLPSLQGLKAEIGFSLDGWGKVGSWIR